MTVARRDEALPQIADVLDVYSCRAVRPEARRLFVKVPRQGRRETEHDVHLRVCVRECIVLSCVVDVPMELPRPAVALGQVHRLNTKVHRLPVLS